MNNSSIITDPRAKRWGNAAKWLLLFPLGFIVAPYVMTAVFGLLGLLLGVGIIVATWMIRPWVFSVAANARLMLIKREASRNPVETLESELKDKMIALDARKTNIEKLNAQIMTFGDKVDEIAARYGPQDSGYIKLKGDLVNLKRVYANRCAKWKEARGKLDEFAEAIKRGHMIWDAACAAAAARETSGLTEDEFLSQLRIETAFDSIQDGYNAALASLDADLDLDFKAVPALPAPDSRATIDIAPASVKSKSRAY